MRGTSGHMRKGDRNSPTRHLGLHQYNGNKQNDESKVRNELSVALLYQGPPLNLMNRRRHVEQMFGKHFVFTGHSKRCAPRLI